MAGVKRGRTAIDIHEDEPGRYCDNSEEDTEEAMDESRGPLEESGCTRSDDSEEELEDYVQEDILKFEDSFRGITKRYRLINRIGEGTFSTVYKAEDLHYHLYKNDWDTEEREESKWSPPPAKGRPIRRPKPRYVAIKKIYVTSSPLRILNELELLHDLKESDSVCPLITAFRHHDQVIAILPYFQHRDFREYFRDFTVPEMRQYFHSLFTALKAVHEHKILHRDIKPTNFLYSPTRARGVLVDFGLAEREGTDWHPCNCQLPSAERQHRVQTSLYATKLQQSDNPHQTPSFPKNDNRPSRRANRAGTRGFRAPEVLLKCTAQTTLIDVWSVGIVLLTLLTRRFPFFHSADDIDALLELGTAFGKRRLAQTAFLHGQVFETNIPTISENGHTFEKIILWCTGRSKERDGKGGLSSEEKEAVEFLKRCLELEPGKRITAAEALRHPFLVGRGEGGESEDEIQFVQ
ncbi:hypothetical protein B0A49_01660 [Cryomyces minteri]|uniref:non-specific serine/threonine protein kinase n=1 Tax=Cryomyces minteri TaxID=331657 RepID=A0A4U0XUY5_9PEZI|nr:hypothetical protein B0A49_01660 [Cryomyces minteri]